MSKYENVDEGGKIYYLIPFPHDLFLYYLPSHSSPKITIFRSKKEALDVCIHYYLTNKNSPHKENTGTYEALGQTCGRNWQ